MQHQGRRRLPEVGIVDQVGMQAGEEPRHLIKVMQGHDGPSLGHEPQPDEVSREGPFEKRPALVPAAFVRAIGMHAVRKQPEEDRPGESRRPLAAVFSQPCPRSTSTTAKLGSFRSVTARRACCLPLPVTASPPAAASGVL